MESKTQVERPYIFKEKIQIIRFYNPNYGDNRICICGHPYYHHFDTYENMADACCKYCGCGEFIELNDNGN